MTREDETCHCGGDLDLQTDDGRTVGECEECGVIFFVDGES